MTDDKTSESIFDIPDSEGLTESERFLVRLCRKSFLSLWSYANLHTDAGQHATSSSPKELADVLVVFGSDVILFSDKHIKYDETKPVDIAWPRWRKRTIDKSVSQLYGALSWVRRFPERIFLDSQCRRPLSIRFPALNEATYYLVAVTRGSAEACSKSYPGSIGTHLIDTDVLNVAGDRAFTVGRPGLGKPFVHVFDERSLEIVLNELDTVTDFIEYLRVRQQFLSDNNMRVMVPGEEQLVSAYMTNMIGDDHYFISQEALDKKPTSVLFDGSHFVSLIHRPEYRAKKQADVESYRWDWLVEKFISTGDPRIVHPDISQGADETEEALRAMASVSRFGRRMLIHTLKTALQAASARPGVRWARLFSVAEQPKIVYIFLIVPKRSEETYEEYRQYRIAILHAYCRCAKLQHPTGTTFIGFGFDHPVKDYQGGSEDLMVYTCADVLASEEQEKIERMRNELGILGKEMITSTAHDDEFPSVPMVFKRSHKNKGEIIQTQKKEKHRRKAAKDSRRRNRRK